MTGCRLCFRTISCLLSSSDFVCWLVLLTSTWDESVKRGSKRVERHPNHPAVTSPSGVLPSWRAAPCSRSLRMALPSWRGADGHCGEVRVSSRPSEQLRCQHFPDPPHPSLGTKAVNQKGVHGKGKGLPGRGQVSRRAAAGLPGQVSRRAAALTRGGTGLAARCRSRRTGGSGLASRCRPWPGSESPRGAGGGSPLAAPL